MLLLSNKLPERLLLQILSKEMAHLDTRNFENVNLPDLMYEMRTHGVEKLKCFQTALNYSEPMIRVQQLVPNERLVILNVRQLHCCNDECAVLAIKFPLLT